MDFCQLSKNFNKNNKQQILTNITKNPHTADQMLTVKTVNA
jgi:hypothetical protein